MNSIIRKNASARTFLRPLAAMLIMGMAGSVFASPHGDTEQCVAEKLAGSAMGKAEAQRQCAADGSASVGTLGQGTAHRPSANDLHPHLGFGSDTGAAADARGDKSIAIGSGAVAGDDDVGDMAIALGSNARARAWGAMAIGNDSEVTVVGGIAIGKDAKVRGMDDPYVGGAADGVAIGNGAWVGPNRGDGWPTDGVASVALGKDAHVLGDHAVAIGSGSEARDDYTVAVGSSAQRRRIVNMDAGIANSDAVNVGQLNGAASALGGGARVGDDGSFIAPTYHVQGVDHRSVEGALTGLDEGLKATNERVDALEVGGGDSLVSQDDLTGDISLGKSTGGNLVDFAGTDGARVLTGIADGAVVAGSRDAVNGGQLAAIRDELSGRVDHLDGRVEKLESGAPGDGGGTPPGPGPGGPGNDAGGRPISNVGDGVADSDAANVGQVNKQVEQALGTARQYTDQRVDALAGALDSFKGEVNDRFARQDQRMNQIGAMSAANSQMAINAAGVGEGRGRIAVGVGMQSNQKAMAIGYAKSINPRVRISVGGSFSGSQNSIGAGMGFDL